MTEQASTELALPTITQEQYPALYVSGGLDPYYQQIRNQIVLGISDGRIAPGEQLPTVRALAEEIGINSMTVSKAYTLLKQEGYIYTDRRSGARVRQEFETNKELSEKSQELLRQIISEAKVSGMTQTEFFDLCKRIYKG